MPLRRLEADPLLPIAILTGLIALLAIVVDSAETGVGQVSVN